MATPTTQKTAEQAAKESQFWLHMRDKHTKYYLDTLHLENLKDRDMAAFIKERISMPGFSHRDRMTGKIATYRHNILLPRTKLNMAAFKMTYGGLTSVYAYLYTECIGGEPVFKYVSFGPSLISQDGEYRGRLIPYNRIAIGQEFHPDQWAIGESIFVDRMNNAGMEVQVDLCNTFVLDERCKISRAIDDNRVAVQLFVLAWLVDMYKIHYNIEENHMNAAYHDCIYDEDEIADVEGIVNEIGHRGYDRLINNISTITKPMRVEDEGFMGREPAAGGQKFLALTSLEATRTEDVNFATWCEIYLSCTASNLVLNMISPSFVSMINWFYVQNSHAGVFDNFAMHEKYEHSKIASEISRQVAAADRLNYQKIGSEMKPISAKFNRLSRSLRRSIIYSDSNIKLTDATIAFAMEYGGATFRDIPRIALYESEHLKKREKLTMFENKDHFSRTIFEYVYAFHVLHEKVKVIHTDAHLNNITMMRMHNPRYKPDRGSESWPSAPKVMYAVGPELYWFDYNYHYPVVIDFSRALFGSHQKLEHEFSANLADMFIHDQYSKLFHTILRYLPAETAAITKDIETIVINNFYLVFKIASAVDHLAISRNIRMLVETEESFTSGKIKVSPQIIALLRKIERIAHVYVIDNLKLAIAGTIAVPEDIEYCGAKIIRECFGDFKFKPADKKTPFELIDFFNGNNEIIYEVDDYDLLSPMLKMEPYLEAMKELNYDMTKEWRDWIDFMGKDEVEDLHQLRDQFEHDESEVMQIEHWMLL